MKQINQVRKMLSFFKKTSISLCVLVISLTVTFPVRSKNLSEIEKEIEQKEGELETLEDDLDEAKGLEKYYENKTGTTGSELEETKNELKKIEAKIKINKKELQRVKEQIKISELKIKQKEMTISEKLTDLYIYNRKGIVDLVIENRNTEGLRKEFQYREVLLASDLEEVESMSRDLAKIEQDKKESEKLQSDLDRRGEKLAERKKELQESISYFSSMASYNENRQSGIRAQMGDLSLQIEGLTEDQRQMLEEEKRLIENANGGTKPLVSGEYYFYGRGRALYQGHGLGFSQYGAYGGAKKGMGAKQIAKFYYPGSVVRGGHENKKAPDGTNIEKKISHLGEIPDKACGTKAQVRRRPDKYALDNPNTIWDCWPEASIEAQVIVARSYALAGGTQQVYKPTTGKKWAVDETRGQALEVGGNVIAAYFSADNNNGWGTATHRKPVWCGDFHGNCSSGYSWIQGVKDSTFAAKGPYTDWRWRTNSYTKKELETMLKWYSRRGYSMPRSSDVRNLLSNIGKLKTFQIEKEKSGRMNKINVVGTKGSEKINGEFFKIIFNYWVGNVKPSGEVDPLFSITTSFAQVP